MVLTYMLMVVTTMTIGYNHNASVTMHEFKNKDDCDSAIHYIKSSTRAKVEAYCMPMIEDGNDFKGRRVETSKPTR